MKEPETLKAHLYETSKLIRIRYENRTTHMYEDMWVPADKVDDLIKELQIVKSQIKHT